MVLLWAWVTFFAGSGELDCEAHDKRENVSIDMKINKSYKSRASI